MKDVEKAAHARMTRRNGLVDSLMPRLGVIVAARRSVRHATAKIPQSLAENRPLHRAVLLPLPGEYSAKMRERIFQQFRPAGRPRLLYSDDGLQYRFLRQECRRAKTSHDRARFSVRLILLSSHVALLHDVIGDRLFKMKEAGVDFGVGTMVAYCIRLADLEINRKSLDVGERNDLLELENGFPVTLFRLGRKEKVECGRTPIVDVGVPNPKLIEH